MASANTTTDVRDAKASSLSTSCMDHVNRSDPMFMAIMVDTVRMVADGAHMDSPMAMAVAWSFVVIRQPRAIAFGDENQSNSWFAVMAIGMTWPRRPRNALAYRLQNERWPSGLKFLCASSAPATSS